MVNALVPASAVFLVLYTILLVLLLLAAATRQIKLKSRWGFVLVHVTLRLAAQSVGVAFGMLGFQAPGLLIAYLVLGAEGYFSLVLCTARFLISYQNHTFGDSWMEPRRPEEESLEKSVRPKESRGSRLLRAGTIMVTLRDPQTGGVQIDPQTGQPRRRLNCMAIVHNILIAANVMIVLGGSLLSSAGLRLAKLNPADIASAFDQDPDVATSKGLRAAGQAIFLVFTLALAVCIVKTMFQARSSSRKISGEAQFFGHPLLLVLLCAMPFLIARGVFGVCQAIINSLNYTFPSVYGPDGLVTEFVVTETILTTLMEWISCALLVSTWPILRNQGYSSEIEQAKTSPVASVSEIGRVASPVHATDKAGLHVA